MPRLPDTSGFGEVAGYSRAVRHGSMIAVSATAPLEGGEVVHPGDAYGQALYALERAVAAAESLGATKDGVLRTRLLLAPGCDWREAVRAHGETFAEARPANTTYFVGSFIPDGVLVEVELDAIVSEGG